jgi:hypothetical protein
MMAEYELVNQLPDGAFSGWYSQSQPVYPVAFDTGQIILVNSHLNKL